MSKRDIVVTIPASKLAEVDAEERDVARMASEGKTDVLFYWQMGRLPKEQPRRVYFVWNEAVRAYHDVAHMDREQGCIFLYTQIHEIQPIPMKGFRGFRYM